MDGATGTALSGLFATVIALAVVLALAYGSLRLFRVWQERTLARAGPGMQASLRFIRALAVGPRERVLLIEAEGERLLIGVSAGNVSLLRRYGPAVDAEAAPELKT